MVSHLTRGAIILAACALLVPLAVALLAAPARAQAPTLVVSSPQPGAVVTGDVLFQGTVEDSDGNLDSVEIAIEGANPALKVKFPGAKFNATWEKSWNSQGAPDGLREVSIFAVDKAGETSQPVNFPLLVDNFKEPRLVTTEILFDAEGDSNFAMWRDLEAVPTTRLSFELSFSEEMDEASLGDSVSFLGGEATWQLASQDGLLFWLNVSYVQVDTAYSLTVANSTTDLAGNPLMTPYELSFRTAAEATPGTPTTGGAFFLPIDPLWLWISGIAGGATVAGVVVWKKGLHRRFIDSLRSLSNRLRRRD
ncbi:MAG: Ig-like domain-containing protein [Thermoplasmata archaeon]